MIANNQPFSPSGSKDRIHLIHNIRFISEEMIMAKDSLLNGLCFPERGGDLSGLGAENEVVV